MATTTEALATQNGATHQTLVGTMAARYGLDPGKFYKAIQKTIFPQNVTVTEEQTAAFLMVANHYQLNPFTKEIYAFPAKGGGIQPVVSIDGWVTLINRQPEYDGAEFHDHMDQSGKLVSVTCRIHHKGRSFPLEVTEYMDECRRETDPWKKWPARMLRHKALIQCARYAFGFAGIIDPDEAERYIEVGVAEEPKLQMPIPKSQKMIEAATEPVHETLPGDANPETEIKAGIIKQIQATVNAKYDFEAGAEMLKLNFGIDPNDGAALEDQTVDRLNTILEELKATKKS